LDAFHLVAANGPAADECTRSSERATASATDWRLFASFKAFLNDKQIDAIVIDDRGYARIAVLRPSDNVAKIIDTCAEEADRSNASAVVHKSRSEAEGAFFRQLIDFTAMEKR
jgi:hypothetical protein